MKRITEALAVMVLIFLITVTGSVRGFAEEAFEPGPGGPESEKSTVVYNETDTLNYGYIAVADPVTGTMLELERGAFTAYAGTVSGETGSRTVSVIQGTAIKVKASGDNFALSFSDPPGTDNFIFVTPDGTLSKDSSCDYTVYGNWNTDEYGLYYLTDGSYRYYLCADGTVSASVPESGSTVLFGGDTEPGGGGTDPGGEGTDPGGENLSEIEAVDLSGPTITKEPEAVCYVLENSEYLPPVFSVAAMLPEDSEATEITFTWYLNGEEAENITVNASAGEEKECTYTASELSDLSFGVYPVYCVVSCTSETENEGGMTLTVHRNTSFTVNFIVCRGIQTDSVFTFSDVHESFSNIGSAIGNIMGTDGLIPALIICTGDWANGRYAGGDSSSENYAFTKDNYIKRIKALLGGIDTVFVSGNHDNTAASVAADKEAALGATGDLDDGCGIIFDSDTAKINGTTSKEANNLIVYGISFEAVQTESGFSYEKVITDLDKVLSELRERYKGQLVIISSHSGLHALENRAGENEYNIDGSAGMVSLLNRYSETGMNIIFLFGHNHSKGESEFFYTPGETVTSTVSYAKNTSEDNVILFSYGHAGYITGNINGSQSYSEIIWTDSDNSGEGEIIRLMSGIKAPQSEDDIKTVKRNVAYQITKGDKSFVKCGGTEEFSIEVNGDSSIFTGVAIDGKTVASENYTLEEGSTVIKLSISYINTLSYGTHTVSIEFKNGEAKGTFEILGGEDTSDNGFPSPDTGDNNPVLFYIALLMLSLAAAAALALGVIKKDK